MSLEYSARQDLKNVRAARSDLRAIDRPPLVEPLRGRGETAQPGIDAVGDDHQLVESEEVWELSLVGLKLIEGRPRGGILLARILQLEGRKRISTREFLSGARLAPGERFGA